MDALLGIMVVLCLNAIITIGHCWVLGMQWETLQSLGKSTFDRGLRWGGAVWAGPNLSLLGILPVAFIYTIWPTSGISETTDCQNVMLRLEYGLFGLPIISACLAVITFVRGEWIKETPASSIAGTTLDKLSSSPMTPVLWGALALIKHFALLEENRQASRRFAST